jgi:hypothetical protein
MGKLQTLLMVGRLDFLLKHRSRCKPFMPLVLPMVGLLAKIYPAPDKGHSALSILLIFAIHLEIKFALCIVLLSWPNSRQRPSNGCKVVVITPDGLLKVF